MTDPTPYAKPLPTLTDENQPFWEACREGRLSLQKCSACGHLRYPIAICCPRCLSGEAEWTTLSGRGTVFSVVVFHRAYHPGFKDDVPYNVAMIQLDEGPRMYSNVVGVPNDRVRIGDAVEAVFDAVTPEITIPRFRLRADPRQPGESHVQG
ncbi:MAG: Zn-ribbon domain-containing OB-fold protein [Gammaproteobacteria bacterium]|nr:Zn-ribbon domain-containing OB-fold protein [Gammaproteobacteria bacterium]MBU1441924.1 Zn-ribbon domain-containing OB-fold protein [Gammaproteobacteria bacterium]MBU2285727.1 Zn-ribbon domain-containing OB-fold protein [Gammaproteobacteria bacterium]MBU2410967.1 Zn-ribbon domain-containing OB-fold protein [Gammaproteobacteria bacterium]